MLFARCQLGLSLAFHIVFAVLGVGLPALILFAEWRGLSEPGWRELARRWSHAFAVLFAVGAVSGTILSFELGIAWPTFMGRFGAAIGLPFTLEGFAFFVEAIFLGIYLYGGKRLPPRARVACAVPIAIAGAASAGFVTCVNAWMNAPVGVALDARGQIAALDPWATFRAPAASAEVIHLLAAAYACSGLAVASVYAVGMLRGRRDPHHRRGLAAGLVLGLAASLAQPLTGDYAAKIVARFQPVKLAAMEGQWETRTHAPLRIGGLPDEEHERTRFAIEVPGGLSWLAYGRADAPVSGLSAVPRENRPRTAVVHLAFQVMVGVGGALAALALAVGFVFVRRRRVPESRLLLLAIAAAGPAAFLAVEAGWTVTECGRQPWLVQGLLRTAHGASHAGGLGIALAASIATYLAIAGGTILILRHLAARARAGAPEARDA